MLLFYVDQKNGMFRKRHLTLHREGSTAQIPLVRVPLHAARLDVPWRHGRATDPAISFPPGVEFVAPLIKVERPQVNWIRLQVATCKYLPQGFSVAPMILLPLAIPLFRIGSHSRFANATILRLASPIPAKIPSCLKSLANIWNPVSVAWFKTNDGDIAAAAGLCLLRGSEMVIVVSRIEWRRDDPFCGRHVLYISLKLETYKLYIAKSKEPPWCRIIGMTSQCVFFVLRGRSTIFQRNPIHTTTEIFQQTLVWDFFRT
jgi:hypothetical protein